MLSRFRRHIVVHLGVGLMLAGGIGCSRSQEASLGTVGGTVTLDGVALVNATVRFSPDGRGRTSQGVTDASGGFRLGYLRDIHGANVGRHVVRITTPCEENGGLELLPARYHALHTGSPLQARVQQGSNQIDFQLFSH